MDDADLRRSPKKRGPDHFVPVISRAMAVSERQFRPFHSNPSSCTSTWWVSPCHSRMSFAPGLRRMGGCWRRLWRRLGVIGDTQQPAFLGYRQTSSGNLLDPPRERQSHQVTPNTWWRLRVKQPPPFGTQLGSVLMREPHHAVSGLCHFGCQDLCRGNCHWSALARDPVPTLTGLATARDRMALLAQLG